MKRIFLNILLISILSILSMHSNASCAYLRSFQEAYLKDSPKDDIFFIKGVAWDVFEYGRYIEVIEDLKGNLADESPIFVWGGGCPSDRDKYVCMSSSRMVMTQYNENDTLIMIVNKISVSYDGFIETTDDYAIIGCACSVLKLSNGFVTGLIFPPLEWWQDPEEITMPWEELKALLLNPDAIQSAKINNNICQWNGTIFFENQEYKTVKLSFYDLSGRLVHEVITTSNSYHPVLTRNVFVCKININDELRTIKYVAP